MKLGVPTKANTYIQSTISDFEIAGIPTVVDDSIPKSDKNWKNSGCFYIKINGKLALIDFSEYYDENSWNCVDGTWIINPAPLSPRYIPENLNVPIFKRMVVPWAKYANNVFPYGPFYLSCSTQEKEEFFNLGNIYNPKDSNRIIHTSRIYAQNIYTRGKAYPLIDKSKLPEDINLDQTRLEMQEFHKSHSNCLSSISVSGGSPYTQDAGPIESMLLGVCIISNNFDIMLPYNKRLEADKHYICINKDYTNINDCINFVYNNRNLCKSIGETARNLLLSTSSPKNRVTWIINKVREFYE